MAAISSSYSKPCEPEIAAALRDDSAKKGKAEFSQKSEDDKEAS